MGIPVVATDLAEIRRFNAEHGASCASPSPATPTRRRCSDAVVGGRRCRRSVARRIEVARIEQLGAPPRKDVGADRRGARPQRPARTTGWEDRLRRLYGAAQRRPREDRRDGCSSLLSADLPDAAGVVARRAAAHRRAAADRPTRSSCLPAAWANRDGPAAACRSASRKAVDAVPRRRCAALIIFSSGYVFTLREAEVDEGDRRSPTACRRTRSSSRSAPPTPTRTSRSRRGFSHEHGWRRIAAGQLAVSHAPRAADLAQGRAGGASDRRRRRRAQFYAHERGASLEQIRGMLQEYVGDRLLLVARLDLIGRGSRSC